MPLLDELSIAATRLQDLTHLDLHDLRVRLQSGISHDEAHELIANIEGLEGCARGSEGAMNVEATRLNMIEVISRRMDQLVL